MFQIEVRFGDKMTVFTGWIKMNMCPDGRGNGLYDSFDRALAYAMRYKRQNQHDEYRIINLDTDNMVWYSEL